MSRALTYGSTHAVHRGVATAENHHPFAFHIDVRLAGGFAKAHGLFGVGNQERQRIKDTICVFVFQSAAHGLIGPHAEEHGIILFQ